MNKPKIAEKCKLYAFKLKLKNKNNELTNNNLIYIYINNQYNSIKQIHL